MQIKEITLYPKNAKLHKSKQLKEIAASIKQLGFDQPVVIDKDGIIIIGHGRFLAARDILGWTTIKLGASHAKKGEKFIPVVLRKDLTDEEVKVRRLNDNKLNESPWEMELVLEDLKLLSTEMFELTGFDSDLLIEPDAKDDVIPEKVPAICKLGDLYQLGQHRVLCGDSTQPEAVLRLMGGVKADMVFTDPPYGVDYEGKTKDKLKIKNDTTTEAFKNVLPNYILATKDGASFYVCCPPGNKFKDFFLPFEEVCHLSATIIWAKNTLVMGHGDYHYQHEPILYGWNKKGTHSFYGDRTNTTIWNIDRPTASKLHPTMKPIALVERAIINSSKSEDVILDLFLGSGSTLIACEKTGRICYGMELDPSYCDVIIKRWEEYTSEKAIKL